MTLPFLSYLQNKNALNLVTNPGLDFSSKLQWDRQITLLHPLGRIRNTRIDLGIPQISPSCRHVSAAGLHAADTLWQASIFSHTQMTTRASSLVNVRVGSGHYWAFAFYLYNYKPPTH